jgi:hypothetical protein
MVIVDIDTALEKFPQALVCETFPDTLGEETPPRAYSCADQVQSTGSNSDNAEYLLDDLLDSFDDEDDGSSTGSSVDKEEKGVDQYYTKFVKNSKESSKELPIAKEILSRGKASEVTLAMIHKRMAIEASKSVVFKKHAHSDETSKTDSDLTIEKYAIKQYIAFPSIRGDEESTISEITDTDDDSEFSEESSEGTGDLLEKAQDRVIQQRLYEEVKELKHVLETKNEEIESLAAHLRRATASKCDLVIAHTELENYHAQNIKVKDKNVKQLTKFSYSLLELRAEVEKVRIRYLNSTCHNWVFTYLNGSLLL